MRSKVVSAFSNNVSWSVNTVTTVYIFFLILKSFFKVLFTKFNYCFWRLYVILYVCSVKNVNRQGESIHVGLNLKLMLTTSLLSPLWFPVDFSRRWMLLYVGNLFKHNVNGNDCFDMTKYGHNKSLKTVCLITGSYAVDLFQTCWVSCTNPV